jgi:hypothetical protein
MTTAPVFRDFDFRAHFARLKVVADLTQGSCHDDWDLYLDGMQVLYDAWAAVGTRLNIPTRPQKDATLAISSQVVMALTSAGVLVLSGDYQRSIVCSRQAYEELLHLVACQHDVNAAKRYLRGRTPKPRDIRKAVKAPEIVRHQYDWLSKFAHGGIENARLMEGKGWMPLQSGQPNPKAARIALDAALHVAAAAAAEFIAPFGSLDVEWYRQWTEDQSTFRACLDAHEQALRPWVPGPK